MESDKKSEKEYSIDDDFLETLEPKVTKFYLVRHGESKANVQQRRMSPSMKWNLDPALSDKGIEASSKTGNYDIDLNKYIICSSVLRRAQQTAYNMFLKDNTTGERTLYILPDCGEKRGKNMCHYTHEFQNDNCPDGKMWKRLLRKGDKKTSDKKDYTAVKTMENLDELKQRIITGKKNIPRTDDDFKVDVKYIYDDSDIERKGKDRWLEIHTKVMNPPDQTRFADCLNDLIDLGKIPIVVTHSHFIMEILKLGHDEKPDNNTVFEFTRDGENFNVEIIKSADITSRSITSTGGGKRNKGLKRTSRKRKSIRKINRKRTNRKRVSKKTYLRKKQKRYTRKRKTRRKN